MSSFSSRSSISSAEPTTPHSASFHYPPTSPTPPGSLKDYTASLKSRHALGMAAAMKSLPLEPPSYRRGSDPLQADDNPFDLLYSPTPKSRSAMQVQMHLQPNEFGELRVQTTSASTRALVDAMIGKPRQTAVPAGGAVSPRSIAQLGAQAEEEETDDEIDIDLSPRRPAGILKFQRTESYQSDNNSTPLGSDSSFEAMTQDDYFRMYAHDRPSCPRQDSDYSPFGLSPYLRDRSGPSSPSPLSAQSSSPLPPPSLPQAHNPRQLHPQCQPHSHSPASALAHNSRISTMSTATTSSTITSLSVASTTSASSQRTITSLSSSSSASPSSSSSASTCTTTTIAPAPTPPPALTPMSTAQILPVTVARVARPSLLRPRPRAHPYDPALAPGGITQPRQRETSAGSGRSVGAFAEDEQQMRDDGRSVSEVMVAMAGLRCQRGRGVRGGG